jgi:ElaB/YqjD/DUF883 family membrane-anchored ribosome-binding protein
MNGSEITALEQETENTRSRVSGLLDELRGRVSPGEMVDQMVSYAGDGAGEVVRTLGNQLRNNPLPAVLIGVGVAWLMLSDRRPPQVARPARHTRSTSDALASARDDVMETGSRIRSRVLGAGEGLAASAADTTERAGTLVTAAADRASSAYDEASDAAGRAASTVSDYAHRAAEKASAFGQRAAETAAEFRHRTADGTSALSHRAVGAASQARHTAEDIGKRAFSTANQILHEQPLIAAGIGLAIGAALGTALPSTDAENRLMGSTSDEVKDRARQAAAGQYERVKDAAEDAYGTVADTVAREVSSLSGDESRHDDADYRTQDHGSRTSG